MKNEAEAKPSFKSLWKSETGSVTADKNLELILTTNARLPLRFWRTHFWFIGLSDKTLLGLTEGLFPRKLKGDKWRPLFSLERMANGVGFKVCPCSSKKPFNMNEFRFVIEGCRLLHTNHVLDRNSYLVEEITVNIPTSMALDVRFKGEVPEPCIQTAKRH